MDLRPTWTWFSKLWTVEHLDLNEWFKEGLIPAKYYHKGIGWLEDYTKPSI